MQYRNFPHKRLEREIHGEKMDTMKESGPKGPGFMLPSEGASMVFPLSRQSAGVMKHCKNI
jgi:hypothetical protein